MAAKPIKSPYMTSSITLNHIMAPVKPDGDWWQVSSLWEIKGFFPSVKDLPEIPVRMQTWSKMPESSAKELCQI